MLTLMILSKSSKLYITEDVLKQDLSLKRNINLPADILTWLPQKIYVNKSPVAPSLYDLLLPASPGRQHQVHQSTITTNTTTLLQKADK